MTLKYFVFFACTLLNTQALIYGIEKYNLSMPYVQPKIPSQYLCTPVKINPSTSYYIVGFEPNASMSTVHHILLYGCSMPGTSQSVWNCGEMSHHRLSGKSYASPCKSANTILYAWGRDAPMLKLPDDVAFKVGKHTNINYLVLQVHYNNVDRFKDGNYDNSGVILHYTETPVAKLAGVLLMGTAGFIQPHSLESMETSCNIEEDKAIHPFAFRTHTHELGVRVAGYRVRRINDVDYWTLIGEKDPLEPQMFYNVDQNIIIKKDDYIAAVCKMDATERDYITSIGPTTKDEMCNFYMMYWVEDASPLKQSFCFTSGPPYYRWKDELNNIPQKEKLRYRRIDA